MTHRRTEAGPAPRSPIASRRPATLLRLAFGLFVAALLAGPRPASAEAATDRPVCAAPAGLQRFDRPLPRFAARMARAEPIKIVALGSSSTSGIGATSPGATYPARLEAELRRLAPGRAITVVNRGIPGDETSGEIRRFRRDVLDEAPDLVVWQLGTNVLLAGRDFGTVSDDMRTGIGLLRASGTDVVLMNPQYSPRVLDRPNHPAMIDLIAGVGRETEVAVFDRFAIMGFWARDRHLPFAAFMTDDGLHQNDWAYACLAELLAKALMAETTTTAARR